MRSLASAITKHPRLVVVAWLGLTVVFASLGGRLSDALTNSGYDASGSQSEEVNAHLSAARGFTTTPVLVDVERRGASLAGWRRATSDVATELRGEANVVEVGPPQFASNQRVALLPVVLRADLGEAQKQLPDIEEAAKDAAPGEVKVELVGQPSILREYSEIAKDDLAKADRLALPIIFGILLIAFLSLPAASVPGVLAFAALGVTFGGLYLVSRVTDLSVFVSNTAVFLGLGLSIDYSLFIVSRYREERGHDGTDPSSALITAMSTAGRAVLISAATIAASLASLLLVGLGIFSSMAYGASLAAVVAGAAALTLVPAILTLLGERIDRLTVKSAARAAARGKVWHRIGRTVLAHRSLVTVGASLLLVLCSLPLLGARLDVQAVTVLPSDNSVRQASDTVSSAFGPGAVAPVRIFPESDTATAAKLAQETPGVAAVVIPPAAQGESPQEVDAILTDPPDSDEADDTVKRLRDRLTGAGQATSIGGQTAQGVDLKQRINDRTPLVIAAATLLGFLLLAVSLRSILVPIKALVTSLLSTGAALGLISAGWDLFGTHPSLNFFVPLVLFAIVFGLSIDYELFLLTRIREEYERSGDNDQAVLRGLIVSSRPITLAALVMMVVFLALAASRLEPLQQLGLGLALAILIDATIVRAFLVPAAVAWFGKANWWFPFGSRSR